MSRASLRSRYRTALVTGAGAGLGRAFVDMLLANGIEVWGTSRRPESLPVAERFHPVAFDLAAGADVAEELIGQVERASGGLDLLVHNAGYGIFGGILDQPLAVWRAQLDALLGGSFVLNRAAFAVMAPRRRGGIVNVTSMAVEFPIPFLSGYNIAKAGLAALTESLQLEAPTAGITFLDFRPGDYRTGFNQTMFTSPPEIMPAAAQRVARQLDAILAASPLPGRAACDLHRALVRGRSGRAACDLHRALVRGRSGVVRSGSFFQTVLAPLGVRLMPLALRRAVMARYFGVR